MVRLVSAVVTSIVPVVLLVSVNARSVEAVLPVYCKVPLPITRFAAALVAAPKLPATAPLPMVPTLRTPALMLVIPV